MSGINFNNSVAAVASTVLPDIVDNTAYYLLFKQEYAYHIRKYALAVWQGVASAAVIVNNNGVLFAPVRDH